MNATVVAAQLTLLVQAGTLDRIRPLCRFTMRARIEQYGKFD